jgi:replication factor C small subunit
MERYHRTTQFVVTTRQPSKLIPPIRSRCFPVPVRAPTTEETAAVLEDILTDEGVSYDEDGLEYVAGFAGGDLRKAVLSAQTTAAEADAVTMSAAHEVLQEIRDDDELRSVLAAARRGEFTDARKTLGTFLDEEGYDGQTLLRNLLRVARTEYGGRELARLYELAGDVDADLATGTDDRLHLSHLLAAWAAEA